MPARGPSTGRLALPVTWRSRRLLRPCRPCFSCYSCPLRSRLRPGRSCGVRAPRAGARARLKLVADFLARLARPLLGLRLVLSATVPAGVPDPFVGRLIRPGGVRRRAVALDRRHQRTRGATGRGEKPYHVHVPPMGVRPPFTVRRDRDDLAPREGRCAQLVGHAPALGAHGFIRHGNHAPRAGEEQVQLFDAP